MKPILFVITSLAVSSLAACSIQASTLPGPTANNTATFAQVTPTTSIQTTVSSVDEETEISNVVENFGKRLGAVSLLSPDAAQEIQTQYAEFVSPALLEIWVNDVLEAPGRMVSSPWPDHIEITGMSKEDANQYEVTGFIVEMTSTEVVGGGAAAKIPVRILVERRQGRWLIADYAEEQ